ncbi:hypothetical protein [Rhodobacter sp. CZR27]|uniref:hypothetical protein n=1 Tax=Rhodobacter sp. CZR27 TaxID=2033869 RepID=UPI0018E0A54C|nr:hypothetical protein [Rhodobacter sp. CZR27]
MKARKKSKRKLRHPGTEEIYEIAVGQKKAPILKTPAQRHGIVGSETPNLYRIIYRPWMFMGTVVGARLEKNRAG